MGMKAARITPCCRQRLPHGVPCVCASKRTAERDRTRPSARLRGYDRQWETAAALYLAEPGHELCECGAKATLVRHKQSIAKRPDLRMDRRNWKPGCRSCNAKDAWRDRGVGLNFRENAKDRAPSVARDFF